MSQPPLIIIGAARSGTKFLRDLLATDTALQCVPYDVNYVWRTGNESLPHDELDPATLTPARKRRISQTLHALAKIPEEGPRMVEKSVSNGLRIPFVEAVFPDAHYIHLVRDGRSVIESAMRLWQMPPDTGGLMRKLKDLPVSQYGYLYWFGVNYLKGKMKGRGGGEVWGPRYQGIMDDLKIEDLLTIVSRQWAQTVNKAADALTMIDPARQTTLRYDTLINDPDAIRQLGAFAGVADIDALAASFDRMIQRGNDDKWREKLDGNSLSVIEAETQSTLERFGFV